MKAWSKDQIISVTIPLILVGVALSATYIMPTPAVVEESLSSYFQNRYLELTVKLLSFSLILLSPYFFFQKVRRPNKKDTKLAISQIRDSALAKYELHLNDLSDEVTSISSKFATRGFTLPPGMMAGEVFDLYRNELSIFNDILEETITLHNANNSKTLDGISLQILRSEMLKQKASYLYDLYSGFISTYFLRSNDDMADRSKNNFSAAIERECNLLIRSTKMHR
jgi:hypothetical protein